MVPKKGAKKGFVCSKCGYEEKVIRKPKIKEKLKESTKFGIFDENVMEKKTLPETKAKCPKCGNDKAFFWMAQTRAGDEPETKFLKCTKCGHTWREYS